ncbi:MAG: winged helix-turn-helix transcriptional regulator [Alcaligenaceae bacterium]|nr:winged helix-turn-helix transcriptional regulator [Alcaligenaceae bacterium]
MALELEMMQRVGRIYRTWARLFEAEVGIPGVRWRILLALGDEPVSQKQLVNSLDVDAATLTRHVKAMEKEGWVKRSMDPDDNRITNVLLTVEGKGFRAKTWHSRDAFLAKITIDLPEDEIHVLIATLDKIQARLCHVQFSL